MKKFILTAVSGLLFSFFADAQMMQLSLRFTGQLNAQHINIDSIHIKNISQNGDTSLLWPDTTLNFTFTGVGLQNTERNSEKMQAFLCNAEIENEADKIKLFLPKASTIDISLYDLKGKTLKELHLNLNQGYHSFSFSTKNHGFYLMTFRNKQEQISLKINSKRNASNDNISYIESDNYLNKLKVLLPSNIFNFHPGDSLKITGYYNGDTSIILAAPTITSVFTLTFISTGPCAGISNFSYGGQLYNTVEIGTQCWMKENLNIGTFTGSMYQNNTSHTECSNNGIIEKFCYQNLQSNCDLYGGLYDWNEMMQYTNAPGGQGICPVGWHIPTDPEFQILADYLGGNATAGGQMKEAGFISWAPPNTGANNLSGFTALGAGYRYHYGNFGNIANYESFWSSTEINAYQASFRYLMNTNADLTPYNYIKNYGYSVRCLKN